MKKILTLAAIALIGASTFTSCTKKSDSPSYNMKATIGATSFNVSTCYAIFAAGNLTVSGWSGSSATATPPYINIEIIGWSGNTGTVNFDSTATNGFEEYLPTSTTVSESKTGTVNITSVTSSTISGTFSFTGTDGTVVSNGSFTGKRP